MILAAGSCLLSGRKLWHIYQLESYQLPGYFRSIQRSKGKLLIPMLCVGAVGVILRFCRLPVFVCALVQTAVSAGWFMLLRKQKEKKPFVFTERMKRFLCIHTAILLAAAGILGGFSERLLLCMPALEAIWLAVSAKAAEPVEKKIAGQFVRDAKDRLDRMPNLIKIGITGSYGKTSTKFLLRDILSVRWQVLATPGSFNTTMGVTRVIREMLTPSCEVFIAEMGARHVGDIRELVDLVRPQIGMITSIGPQHLETFGSVERVASTKNELIEGLPADGIAVFAKDGAHCEALYQKCTIRNKYMPGMLLDADDIEVGPWGTRFLLKDLASGEQQRCSTKLLGEHSIENLLLACTAAKALGMTLEEIAQGIARCKPVEHRLQLIDTGYGITIIDDAFNSNPVGAKAAVDVLAAFPGRRIIVTPGMVELGQDEERYNEAFGQQIASGADCAILVGEKHTQPIARGLREAGFDEASLFIVKNLEEAEQKLREILQSGDVVLYENDLPDNY